MKDELLKGNREFIAAEFKPNQQYYETIALRQRPKVLWIGCSDSRGWLYRVETGTIDGQSPAGTMAGWSKPTKAAASRRGTKPAIK
jgi:hypothetical protein